MISVLAHPEARLKDTANNFLATKEFVLNLVSETVAEAMNITCMDAPNSQTVLIWSDQLGPNGFVKVRSSKRPRAHVRQPPMDNHI